MKYFIGNMRTACCVWFVTTLLEQLDQRNFSVAIGMAELSRKLSENQFKQFEKRLESLGLVVLDGKIEILADKICIVIDEMVYNDEPTKFNYSDYIAEKLERKYNYLSDIFKKVKGFTIQHYITLVKIERAKELFINSELNAGEIAEKLHYNNKEYLYNQFKKITGLTPSAFILLSGK